MKNLSLAHKRALAHLPRQPLNVMGSAAFFSRFEFKNQIFSSLLYKRSANRDNSVVLLQDGNLGKVLHFTQTLTVTEPAR